MRKQPGRLLFTLSFLAPAILIYLVFVVYPLLQSFNLSLYRWRGVSDQRTFVGTENFTKLFKDGVFWQALKNNLWLFIVCGLVIVVVGVALAHAMQGTGRGTKFLRSIYLFPQAISLVVVAILWMFLYNPSFGLINTGLKGLGIEGRAWLGEPGTALPAVGVAFVWYALGFYIMLFAAGLKSIPSEVAEAAELDGSLGLHRFWHVTWPMLFSVRRVAVIYVLINVLNIFALVQLSTRGGPDRRSETLLTYLYEQAFKNYEFGYATSIAVANFVIAMVLAGILAFLFRKNPMEARR